MESSHLHTLSFSCVADKYMSGGDLEYMATDFGTGTNLNFGGDFEWCLFGGGLDARGLRDLAFPLCWSAIVSILVSVTPG